MHQKQFAFQQLSILLQLVMPLIVYHDHTTTRTTGTAQGSCVTISCMDRSEVCHVLPPDGGCYSGVRKMTDLETCSYPV